MNSLISNNCTNAITDFIEFVRLKPSDRSPHTDFIGGYQAMGQEEAVPMQSAGLEVRQEDGNGVGMTSGLAGNLTEDQVAAR